MNKRRRIVVHRYIKSFLVRASKGRRFSYKFFRRNYKLFSKSTLRQCVTTPDLFSHSSPKPTYTLQRGDFANKATFLNNGPDDTFVSKEVRIPRVRFVPGYQRVWRRARAALKENLGLRLCFQHKTTRYLARFTKSTTHYSFSTSEMSVGRLFVYSRLLPDMNTVSLFSKNHSLYLNGNAVHTLVLTAVPNYVLQLIVSLKYYITYR